MMVIFRFIVILLVAMSLSSCKAEKPEIQTYTLGLSIEQFVKNLNAKQSQFQIQNAKLTTKDDEFLYLNHQFNKNAMLIGIVNKKDHSVQSITIISTISGKDESEQMMSAMNIPLLISLSMQALNPTIDKTNIGPPVMDLFDSATAKPDQMHHHILNGNDYAVALASADKAYVFSAVPVNLPQSK